MIDRAIWLLAGAGALGLFLSATAQTDGQTDGKAALGAVTTTAPPVDDAPVIYPRRSRVKSAAAAAPAAPVKSAGSVDWAEVEGDLVKAEASEAEYQRQVRAMELTRPLTSHEKEKMRPQVGLRAASPREFKQVRATELNETRVPVLVPMLPEMRGTLKVAARENAFTAFGDMADGDYVEIIGTRMRVVGGTSATMAMRKKARAADMPELESMNAPYEISHHEQGVDLSFSRFNVAYQVSVTCEDPAADAHCAGDDFAISIANSLAILNREQGAQP
jgi:hypothetical protein